MSSDQLTYVLVAGLVTGLAILLLLAGAFVARRGSRGERQPAAPGAPQLAALPSSRGPEPRHGAAMVAPPAREAAAVPEPEVAPEPEAVPAAAPEPGRQAEAVPGPEATTAEPEEAPAVTAADLEAARERVHDPRELEVIADFLGGSPRRRVVAAEAGRPPTAIGPLPAPGPAEPEPAAPTVTEPAAPEPLPVAPAPRDPYVDETTGLDSRAAWERAVAEENARYVRYRRPVSVVVGELDGLRRFEEHAGPEAARRILGAVGASLRRGARRTDRVAHAGGGRFLVLMPETDEIQAINYVERVRAECERWLEASAVALRLSVGWASPSAVGELDTALRTAEERMYAERRRAARAGIGDGGGPR